MKKPVMQRSMFMAAVTKPKSSSGGIMSGFDDSEGMDDLEDDYADRIPENLEIIANNIRGDIRSLDERYMELAMMVGEAAFDTPEEVLALMQSQMPPPAQEQEPAGIAGLGAPPPAAPQGIMAGVAETPQPPMPQQPAPEMGAPMQQPMQMAEGGLVYRQAGSPPWGEIAENLKGFRLPPLPAIGDTPEGRRQLGFMRYLPQGTIPGASEVPPRSTAIPRVVVQQTSPMTGFLSSEAANFLQSSAARGPQTLPQRIPPGLRAATAVSEAGRNIMPFARDVGRTLMGTPQGRIAGGVAALGASTLPFLGGSEDESGAPKVQYSEVPGPGGVGVPASMNEILGLGETQPFSIPAPSNEEIESEMLNIRPNVPVPMPGEEEAAGEAPAGETAAGKLTQRERETPKDFRERVKEKMDIYKEFLGDDENSRKAQALFLLAESFLNVAGATGRSNAERLAKGLKGLPAGMAALSADSAKDKKSLAAAAISAVEKEDEDIRRSAAAVAKELAKKGSMPEKVASLYSSIMARNPEMDPRVAQQLARDMDNGVVYQDDKTKETYDKLDNVVRYSPHKPLSNKSVGYLDPETNPYVKISEQNLEQAITPDQRKTLLDEREKLQKNIPLYDRYLADVYGDTVGILPTIKSGVSQLTLALVGDTGLGLTDVQKNAARQRAGVANEYVTRGLFRNNSRVSNLDMQRAESLAKDPNKLGQSSELVVAAVQTFAQQDLNRLAEIDSQLFGTPLKQLEPIPTGAKTDPLPVGPKSNFILEEAFKKRPNLAVWMTYTDPKTNNVRTFRMTANDYFAQQRAQQGPAR